MEEIRIKNKTHIGEKYDIQTVELMAFKGGASVHFQIMKCRTTGRITTPSVDIFAHSSNKDILPSNFQIKIFTDSKMTKKTEKKINYSVIKVTTKEDSE